MANSLASRLQPLVALTQDEQLLLAKLSDPLKTINPSACVLSDATSSTDTYIVSSGYAIEYRLLRNGGRQILRLLLSGDIIPSSITQSRSEYSALGALKVDSISARSLDFLMSHPRLRKAWLMALKLDNEALSVQMVRIGRKSAIARLAHFLCETYYRMKARNQTSHCKFHLPFTQQELGDHLGISNVHTNRSLRQLVSMRLIEYKCRSITMLDQGALERVGEFSRAYLFIDADREQATDKDELHVVAIAASSDSPRCEARGQEGSRSAFRAASCGVEGRGFERHHAPEV